MSSLTLAELKKVINSELDRELTFSGSNLDLVLPVKREYGAFPYGCALAPIYFAADFSNGITFRGVGRFLLDFPFANTKDTHNKTGQYGMDYLFNVKGGYGLPAVPDLDDGLIGIPEGLTVYESDTSDKPLGVDDVCLFVNRTVSDYVGDSIDRYADVLDVSMQWWADMLWDYYDKSYTTMVCESGGFKVADFFVSNANESLVKTALSEDFELALTPDFIGLNAVKERALQDGDIEKFFDGNDFYLGLLDRFVPGYRERFEEVRQELLAEQ